MNCLRCQTAFHNQSRKTLAQLTQFHLRTSFIYPVPKILFHFHSSFIFFIVVFLTSFFLRSVWRFVIPKFRGNRKRFLGGRRRVREQLPRPESDPSEPRRVPRTVDGGSGWLPHSAAIPAAATTTLTPPALSWMTSVAVVAAAVGDVIFGRWSRSRRGGDGD